ncbi:MAG: hypothetical protein MI750_06000 [Xanthomonadales bacterium]|nr:hypothetical protein [Xanthomonadales bacterium]
MVSFPSISSLRASALLLALLALNACSQDAESTAQTEAQSSAERNASAASKTTAVSDSANHAVAECILAAKDDPCAIMSDAAVRESFGLAEQELSYQQIAMGNPSCRASWNGGRQQSIDLGAAGTHSTAVDDEAGINSIIMINDDVERAAQMFAMQTRSRSAEEKRKLAEHTAEQVGRSESIDEEHQEMAQDFARSMMSKLDYQAVEGVGDAAAWGGVGRFKQLAVRVANVRFEVSVTVAEDEAKNREAAIEFAKNVLSYCE